MIKKLLKWIYLIPVRRKLRYLGKNSMFRYPRRIERGQFISIGEGANIYTNVMLQAVQETPEDTPSITIGKNVRIWSNVQVSAAQKMIIGNDVVLSANSFVTDTTHPYEDISHAPRYNKLRLLTPVVIGDDTWVGRNAIISGAKVGKHCVIGAGSMVSKDVPDYCVVVGNPARIVKRYNPETEKWQKTDKDGNFV